MKIPASDPALVAPLNRRVSSERGIQQVFADVLASVGRDGYVSAENRSDRPVDSGSITASWNEWVDATGYTRYSTLDSAPVTLDEFGTLLTEANAAGGYAAPQAYLSSLNNDQLNTIQKVHHLAGAINVNDLSEEGALNLLLPPPAQVDVNNDGLTQSGIGYTLRFPDSRTPRTVVNAWDEATEGLDSSERMLRELQMKVDVLFANVRLDQDGGFLEVREPGEPGFVNPMADANYSFRNKARDFIESIEYFKHQTPPDQYRRDHQFWTSFAVALSSNNAP